MFHMRGPHNKEKAILTAMREKGCTRREPLKIFANDVADFPAVFCFISYWYLLWNTHSIDKSKSKESVE